MVLQTASLKERGKIPTCCGWRREASREQEIALPEWEGCRCGELGWGTGEPLSEAQGGTCTKQVSSASRLHLGSLPPWRLRLALLFFPFPCWEKWIREGMALVSVFCCGPETGKGPARGLGRVVQVGCRLLWLAHWALCRWIGGSWGASRCLLSVWLLSVWLLYLGPLPHLCAKGSHCIQFY